MKTVLEYLNECKDAACQNLFCCSANYGMSKPKEGQESQFAEYNRDIDIVDELIAMVKEKDTRLCECPLQEEMPIEEAAKLISKHQSFYKELENNATPNHHPDA